MDPRHAAIADGMGTSPISCPLRQGSEQFLRGARCWLDRYSCARRQRKFIEENALDVKNLDV
jgi:hypothetical protein